MGWSSPLLLLSHTIHEGDHAFYQPWFLDELSVKADSKVIRQMYRMSEGLHWILHNHCLAFELWMCQMSSLSVK